MSRSLISLLASRFCRPSMQERRAFLRQSLAASASMLLSASTPLGAQCASDAKRVIVIGAGFSGLACAYELLHAGYEVTVIEARKRIGGRVLSANAANGREFVKGKNVEFGAELIGSNHPLWVGYAERFQLEFLDVTDDEEAEYPVVIDGKKLSGDDAAKLWEELDTALNELNKLATPIMEDEPWNSPNAGELDQTSIQDWIDKLDVSPLVKRAVWINQTADNGQRTERQSLLGQLGSVKGGGLEKYWSESEVYRCKGGNDQLATKLASAIGAERIKTGVAIQKVTRQRSMMLIETTDGSRLECDDVVLTAPPRTWSRITFSPDLPKRMKPQTGLNAKYFAVVKNRFWEQSTPRFNQYALSDGMIHMTWDGTDNQREADQNEACLVGFHGGEACEKALQMIREEREKAFTESLEAFFPGFQDQRIKSFYMDWPNERWAAASYSFPAPGEVTTVGPLLQEPHMEGHLHVAGEHTCYKFVGYMEGALQSGARVARTLAARDGVGR